jgi:hypothetical protein
MTAKNLSTVATDIVETYGKTAINTITTYRVGSERLIDFVDQRVASAAVGGVARMGSDLRSNVMDAKKRLRSLYLQGLTFGADQAQNVVAAAVVRASKGIERFAANANRIDRITVSAVDMLARAALPAAQVVSQVAGRVELGSDRLARRVADDRGAIDRPYVLRESAVRTQVVASQRKIGAPATKKKTRTAPARKKAAATRGRTSRKSA